MDPNKSCSIHFVNQESESSGMLQPPPRVLAAMDFLRHLTAKVRSRPAVSDVGIEIIEGVQLTTAESNAQASAANFLSDYFQGNTKPDWWESEDTGKGSSGEPKRGGLILRCVGCGMGKPSSTCMLCQGTGELIVFPVGTTQHQAEEEEEAS